MLIPLLLATITALSFPPQGYERGIVKDSPKHTFRIEVYGREDEGETELSIWVVAPDGSHADLLVGPDELSSLYSVDVDISPDERWIMWDQKLYHGANAISLYERVSGIHYRKIEGPLFSNGAWHFLSEQTHRDFVTNHIYNIICASDWPTHGARVRKISLQGEDKLTPFTTPNDHSLVVSLYGDDGKTRADVWLCYYDLEKHRFYLDAALKRYNRGRVGPSAQK